MYIKNVIHSLTRTNLNQTRTGSAYQEINDLIGKKLISLRYMNNKKWQRKHLTVY